MTSLLYVVLRLTATVTLRAFSAAGLPGLYVQRFERIPFGGALLFLGMSGCFRVELCQDPCFLWSSCVHNNFKVSPASVIIPHVAYLVGNIAIQRMHQIQASFHGSCPAVSSKKIHTLVRQASFGYLLEAVARGGIAPQLAALVFRSPNGIDRTVYSPCSCLRLVHINLQLSFMQRLLFHYPNANAGIT